MITIGNFKRDEHGIIRDEIRTPQVATRAEMIPVGAPVSDASPDFRVLAPNRVELGTARRKASNEGKTYYSVSLDDPSFGVTLDAALIATAADPDLFDLIWWQPRTDSGI